MDVHARRCPYCEGNGCEECDETGFKYRATWTTPSGIPVSATGSGERPSEETRAAIEALAVAAAERLA